MTSDVICPLVYVKHFLFRIRTTGIKRQRLTVANLDVMMADGYNYIVVVHHDGWAGLLHHHHRKT